MKDYGLSKGKIAELGKLHRSLRDKCQADRVKNETWTMASLTPAKVIGADNAKGSLATDKDADILKYCEKT